MQHISYLTHNLGLEPEGSLPEPVETRCLDVTPPQKEHEEDSLIFIDHDVQPLAYEKSLNIFSRICMSALCNHSMPLCKTDVVLSYFELFIGGCV